MDSISLHPLFDSFDRFKKLGSNEFFSEHSHCIKEYIIGVDVIGAMVDYEKSKSFLYSNCRASEGTYNSVRIDVERLLLWSWLVKKKTINLLKRNDLEDYLDFLNSPNKLWISKGAFTRFTGKVGHLEVSEKWKPFNVKSNENANEYKIKPTTLKQTLASLSSLYEFLVELDYAYGNLIPSIRSKCIYLTKNRLNYTVLRFSDEQWKFVLESLTRKADFNPKYERVLFIIVTMKALYLRISELCDRPEFHPSLSDFKNTKDGKFLLIFGKGKKDRVASVPEKYIPYLMRYRKYRKLEPVWPPEKEGATMLCTSTGKPKNLTSRQVRRLIESAFSEIYVEMSEAGYAEDAEKLNQATTHWLRHTGASMDIENGRPLKHISEDLGHSSSAFTDAVYVQSDLGDRAKSGKGRSV